MVIESFIAEVPKELNIGLLHIINEGEYKNYICYCPSKSSGWKLQKPNKSMIFFVKDKRNFFLFDELIYLIFQSNSHILQYFY